MRNIKTTIQSRAENARHQWRLRNARRAIEPSGFYFQPDPPTPGNYSTGLTLLSGEIFANFQVGNLSADSVWDFSFPSEHLIERMHAFEWMEDLASVKTHDADRKIRAWTFDWLERYGRGDGIGWRIEILAWRILRMITYSPILLADIDIVDKERFYESMSIQVHYLINSISKAEQGLPKTAAIIASIFAAFSLEQFRDDADNLLQDLEEQCTNLVEHSRVFLGSRNPDELSQIFCLLVWCDQLLEQVDEVSGRYHNEAVDTIGQAVRALRFGERAMLPAHGGGTGNSIEIERALSYAQIQGAFYDSDVLGFRHIRASALTAFFDWGAPPSGEHHDKAHASTLGLWVAERNQVLIGAGGSAVNQPLVKSVEMQETRAHSTCVISDQSSSELSLKKDYSGQYTVGATIAHPANIVHFDYEEDTQSINVEATHDGYQKDFGYLHTRKLLFDRDGLYFGGIDILQAESSKDEKKVKQILGRKGRNGVSVDIYFHLGPKLKPIHNRETDTVHFKSEAGAEWVFRQEGGKIEISESDYFVANRFKPVNCHTIAIRTRLLDTSGYVTWSFQANTP